MNAPRHPRPRNQHELRCAWRQECTAARTEQRRGSQWRRLERHILSQPSQSAPLLSA